MSQLRSEAVTSSDMLLSSCLQIDAEWQNALFHFIRQLVIIGMCCDSMIFVPVLALHEITSWLKLQPSRGLGSGASSGPEGEFCGTPMREFYSGRQRSGRVSAVVERGSEIWSCGIARTPDRSGGS